jgi:hypothetical protein
MKLINPFHLVPRLGLRGAMPPFSLVTPSRVAEEYEKESIVFLCDVGTGVYNVIMFEAVRFCTLGLCCGVVWLMDSNKFELKTVLRCVVLNP